MTYALDKFLLGLPKSLECLLAFSNLGFQNSKKVISIKLNFALQQQLLINMENDLIKKKETRHGMWFRVGNKDHPSDSLRLAHAGFTWFHFQSAICKDSLEVILLPDSSHQAPLGPERGRR